MYNRLFEVCLIETFSPMHQSSWKEAVLSLLERGSSSMSRESSGLLSSRKMTKNGSILSSSTIEKIVNINRTGNIENREFGYRFFGYMVIV